MNFFTNTRTWKLFAYLFFVPVLMIVHDVFFFDISQTSLHALIEIFLLNLFMVLYGIWFFNLGKKFRLSAVGGKLAKFLGINFVIIITYTVVMNYFIIDRFLGIPGVPGHSDLDFFRRLSPLIITMQIYSTVLYLLTLYLLSKSMLQMENGNAPGLKKIINLIILFIVSPIGVWIIQPRIRKLFGETK